MKAFVVTVVFALGLGTAIAAKPDKKDVVLIGTVIAIDEIVGEFSVDQRVVTVSVARVVSGDLKGPTLKFSINGVAGVRLKIGGTYQVRARWKGDGYVAGEPDIRTVAPAPGEVADSKDLLFVAKVTAIKTSETGDPRRGWIVSTNVERTLSGKLAARTFQFALHSPAQAGLKVGKSYTIPAHWTGTGYEVDELNIWRHNH
jgi:hypothetical protein